MPFVAFRKAVGPTLVGVSWRLVVFVVVALCFSMLMSLREWHNSYAPSETWTRAVEQKNLAWSPAVGLAARSLSAAEPQKKYPNEDSFYRELLSYIRGDEESPRQKPAKGYSEHRSKLAQQAATVKYRELLESRNETEENFERQIRPRDREIVRKSEALRDKNEKIAAAIERIERLKGLQEKSADHEEVIKAEEEKLEKLRQQKPLFTEVRELVIERGTIEAGFQEALSDLSARIKDKEEGIRDAFDAAPFPARPVSGSYTGLQILAMQIGNENDPRHILYVMAWYGLEAAIVLLLCFVFVPWLIRLLGNASDPKDLRSKVTERIRDWLTNAFGKTVANGVSKAIVVAIASSITAAGVTMAAGDQPPLIPPMQHEGDPVAGTNDDQDKADQPGSDQPENPKNPEDGGEEEQPKRNSKDVIWIVTDNLAALSELQSKLKAQAKTIDDLHQKLKTVTADVATNVKSVRDLNEKADKATENMNLMSAGMGKLTQGMGSLTEDVTSLSGGVGGLYAANQSILRLSDARSQYVLGSLYRLEQGTDMTTSDVKKVRTTIEQAAKGVPPVATDLLRINAIPDGAWTRVNPFRLYHVTEEVKNTLERAMQGTDSPQKAAILVVLDQLMDKGEMRTRQFNRELHSACKSCDADTRRLFQQWTPLIVKVSRVQE